MDDEMTGEEVRALCNSTCAAMRSRLDGVTLVAVVRLSTRAVLCRDRADTLEDEEMSTIAEVACTFLTGPLAALREDALEFSMQTGTRLIVGRRLDSDTALVAAASPDSPLGPMLMAVKHATVMDADPTPVASVPAVSAPEATATLPRKDLSPAVRRARKETVVLTRRRGRRKMKLGETIRLADDGL